MGRKKTIVFFALAVGVVCVGVGQVSAITITVDPNERYQTIVGFGGSFDHGAHPHAQRLMNEAQCSVLRIDWCETTSPQAGNNKVLWDAATEKPMVVGSCWSPPAYMKSNNSTDNGGSLLPAHYDAFADYTIQKLKAFKQLYGVEMYGLSLQNEPAFAVFYASCVYAGPDLIDVLKRVGRKMKAEGLTTRIFLPEDMFEAWTGDPRFWKPLFNDEEAMSYVHALAFHGYGADGVSAANMSASALGRMYGQTVSKGWELWQTENGGSYGMKYARDVIGTLRYGKVSMFLKYGMTGDEPGMVGTVEEFLFCRGQPTLTFWVAKAIHPFIKRGSVQIKSTGSDTTQFSSFVAFHDPARNALAVTMATGSEPQSVTIAGASLPAEFELWVTNTATNCVSQGKSSSSSTFQIPANSVATLYGTGYNPSVGVTLTPARSLNTNALPTVGQFGLDGRSLLSVDGVRSPGLFITQGTKPSLKLELNTRK